MASPTLSMANLPGIHSCGSLCRSRGNLPTQGTWMTSMLKPLLKRSEAPIKLAGLEPCEGPHTSNSQRNYAQSMCAVASVVSAAGVMVRRRWVRARGSVRHGAVQQKAEATGDGEIGSKDAGKIPPVLVVNLDRSPERWASCTPQFEEAGVQVTRFPATDGKALQAAEVRECCTPSGRWLCTRGMIGCFLSHNRIWQHVVQEQLPAAVVFEDDVRIDPDFEEKLQKLLAELPADWD